MEEWRVIRGFSNYMVSNSGKIKSMGMRDRIGRWHPGCIMKITDNGNGYCVVHIINDDGAKRKVYVHRAVAIAFIPNKDSKPFVNHIDNNPLNNCVENLEWCTPQENVDWMVAQGRNRRTEEWNEKIRASQKMRTVIGMQINGEKEIRLKSVNEASRFGFQPSCVSNCCNGKRKTHKGFKWVFA